jgi:hypothetical protein
MLHVLPKAFHKNYVHSVIDTQIQKVNPLTFDIQIFYI